MGSDTKKLLKELAKEKSTSMAEIIRRALMTYAYLVAETRDGKHSVTITTSGPEREAVKDVLLP